MAEAKQLLRSEIDQRKLTDADRKYCGAVVC